MNKADNQAGSQAIDSLINYETVKVSFTEKPKYNQALKYLGDLTVSAFIICLFVCLLLLLLFIVFFLGLL